MGFRASGFLRLGVCIGIMEKKMETTTAIWRQSASCADGLGPKYTLLGCRRFGEWEGYENWI